MEITHKIKYIAKASTDKISDNESKIKIVAPDSFQLPTDEKWEMRNHHDLDFSFFSKITKCSMSVFWVQQ